MRRAAACALLVPACFGQVDSGDPWTPATQITGELAPEIGPPPAPRDAPCTLRVATWNLHHAPDPAALAAALAGSTEVARADVLITQEIEAYPDETGSRASRLAAALATAWGAAPTWAYAPARPYDDHGVTGTHGLAMFSRFPLDDLEVRRLPYFDQPIHPEQKIALGATVVLGDRRLRVVDVHLAVRLGPSDRVVQLDPAMNDVGPRFVTGGDYNTNPWAWFDGLVPLGETDAVIDQSQPIVLDDYFSGLGFAGTIPAKTATFPVPLLDIRTDDLYARGLPILAGDVEHVSGSDHWPVWFDVDTCIE